MFTTTTLQHPLWPLALVDAEVEQPPQPPRASPKSTAFIRMSAEGLEPRLANAAFEIIRRESSASRIAPPFSRRADPRA